MKSVKVRLELTNKQSTLAARHAGTVRDAYNWGIDVCKKAFEAKERIPSAIDLHKKLVAEVKTIKPWYYISSKCSPQEALRNLEKAFKNFHRKQKKSGYNLKDKKGRLQGLPNYKKRGVRDSFYLEGAIRTNGTKIKIPKFGWLKCSEILPADEIKNVVISRTADEWFVSFKVAHTPIATIKKTDTVGVDIGIKTLATLSNGEEFQNVKAYRRNKRKLKIAQRKVSKKFVKGAKNQSNNYKKEVKRVARIHQRIANIRKDSIHKLTTYLTINFSEIVIEDLNVRGMLRNHKLASAISDGGFYEFSRQCEYKSQWYGSTLTVVDRFYASSKICSCCGNKKSSLKLTERVYHCDKCDSIIDRDLNASLNLQKKAVSYTVYACGEIQSPPIISGISMKQEANSNVNHCVGFA